MRSFRLDSGVGSEEMEKQTSTCQNFKWAEEDRRRSVPERGSWSQDGTECSRGPQVLLRPLGARAQISPPHPTPRPPGPSARFLGCPAPQCAPGVQRVPREARPFERSQNMFGNKIRTNELKTDGVAQDLGLVRRDRRIERTLSYFFHQNTIVGGCWGSPKREHPRPFSGSGHHPFTN